MNENEKAKLTIMNIKKKENERESTNSSREKIVGGSDGVDVTSEVKIELLHGNHLGVSSSCCSSLIIKNYLKKDKEKERDRKKERKQEKEREKGRKADRERKKDKRKEKERHTLIPKVGPWEGCLMQAKAVLFR